MSTTSLHSLQTHIHNIFTSFAAFPLLLRTAGRIRVLILALPAYQHDGVIQNILQPDVRRYVPKNNRYYGEAAAVSNAAAAFGSRARAYTNTNSGAHNFEYPNQTSH